MSTQLAGDKLKALRTKLSLTQTQFGLIFDGTGSIDGGLSQRAVSHWENGKSSPSPQQLEELLDFLETPSLCTAVFSGRDPNHCALSYCPPYDPKSHHIQCPEDAVFPVHLKGRRRSIESLIKGILDNNYTLPCWSNDLARCFFGVSNQPLSPLLLKRMHENKSRITKDEWESLNETLQRDLETHGLGCFLTVRTVALGNAALSDIIPKLINPKYCSLFKFAWGDSDEENVTFSDDLPLFIRETIIELLREVNGTDPDIKVLKKNLVSTTEIISFGRGVLFAILTESLADKAKNLAQKLKSGLGALRNYETAVAKPARKLLEVAETSLWDDSHVFTEIDEFKGLSLVEYFALREINPERNIILYSHVLVHPLAMPLPLSFSPHLSEMTVKKYKLKYHGTSERLSNALNEAGGDYLVTF